MIEIDKWKAERDERRRQSRNAELVHAVRNGFDIPPAVSSESLHFPPRQVIKKDRREMARIYGEGDK